MDKFLGCWIVCISWLVGLHVSVGVSAGSSSGLPMVPGCSIGQLLSDHS